MGVRGKKRRRLKYGGLDFWNHVSTVDMDADGDLDVMAYSSRTSHPTDWLVWFEGKQVDAVWADGDFNDDGEVSFADFLLLAESFGRSE